MAFEATAADVIRGSSGILYVALGLYLLVPRGRTSAARALGGWCVNFGIGFVIANLLFASGRFEAWPVLLLAASYLLFLPLAGWLALRLPAARIAERFAFVATAVMVILVLILGSVFTAQAGDAGLRTLGLNATSTTRAVIAANPAFNGILLAIPTLCAMRYGVTGNEDRSRRRALVFLSLAIAPYIAYCAGSDLLATSNSQAHSFVSFRDAAMGLAGVLAMSLAWLWALRRRPGREAVVAMLVPLAFALLGLAMIAAFDERPFAWGDVGFVRMLGWLCIVWLVLKENAVGLDLSVAKGRRAGLATSALAILFIVAQVVQNFLSAEYGLLSGGIIAGVVLFAASPVQKAIERATDRKDAREVPATAASDDVRRRREDLYVGALRLAMRDRTLTRDEEVHLHRLAEELGIGAGRAHELMVAVEGERPRKRRVA